MIRILGSSLDLQRNGIGKRFCNGVAAATQPSNKRKPKRRPKVESKSKVISTPRGDYLRVKSFPLLLKMFEKDMGNSLTEFVKMKEKNLTRNLKIVEELRVNEKFDMLNNKKKFLSLSARHRRELNDKMIASLLKENRLLAIHSKSVIKNYLHACVNSNKVDKAYQTLIWHKSYFKKGIVDEYNFLDVSLYNIVLKGYALIGDLRKVEEIIHAMKFSKVVPNIQSFAFHLLCLVKQNEVKDADILQVLKTIRAQKLDPSSLFVKTSLDEENRSLLIKHLLRLEPSLNFEGPEFDKITNCRLMKNFDDDPRTAYLPINDSDSIDYKKALEEQTNAEVQGFKAVKTIYNEVAETDLDKIEYYRSQWKSCEETWRNSFTEEFNRSVNALKKKYDNHFGMNILPFITSLEPNVYIDIMLHEVRSLVQNISYSPPVSVICRKLGTKVMNRYLTQLRVKQSQEIKLLIEECLNYYNNSDLIAKCSQRQLVNDVCNEKKLYLNSDINDMTWSPAARIGVGRFLYNIILRNSKIDTNVLRQNNRKKKLVPVFYEVYVSHAEKTIEELRCNPNAAKLYQLSNVTDLYFDANELPMLVPPFPWINHKLGGYLFTKTDYIREYGAGEELLLGIKLVEKANLSVVNDALNVLSLCAWKINEDVLDVVIDVFRNKGNSKLDIPLHSSVLPPLPKINEMSGEEKSVFYRKRSQLKQERSEMYSLWCDCLYKLSIANHFRKQIIWFPQNLDFRGRVYPVPPHFSHLGGDMSRSILMFAKGKPLGPNGLDWLKIHVINLTGTKKRNTNQERLKYANEIMELIIDSAENPLTGNKWWMDSDEPWQTLACCMEIAKAMKSPNPEEYICHFPVHQDGSCNGLQHYAALGRDLEGGISVNLSPDERPNDVYATVASNVEKLRQIDEKNGVDIAKILNGYINRKVVKQTVMTYVYGVTPYGAKAQILKRLRENDSFPQDHSWSASIYLTSKTFDAIQHMFTATRKIQDWFTSCARVISRAALAPVEWITPLGFPVVQPYFKSSNMERLVKNGELLPLKREVSNWRPNSVKQRNAFPPNFIHSLDSSHMMLTALHCEKKGITFAAVHDSYWTHPCSVDEMNKICREQFVALHSEPILSDLSKFMVDKYEPLLRKIFSEDKDMLNYNLSQLKAVPEKGSFDLEKVLKSVYFFS